MYVEIQSRNATPIRFLSQAGMPAPAGRARCSTCRLKDICLPCGLGGADVLQLDGLMFGQRTVKEGQAVYHAGAGFQFVYAVRSGTFKSVVTLRDGREQVTAFHMAGEVMGMDGVAEGSHASTAVALEDAEICAIPHAQLAELAVSNRDLQSALYKLMGREIVSEHGLMMLLGSMSAEERVAAFLLNVSQRMKARGWSASEFHLRMSRAEIGSYLGLTLETVSRTFSVLQKQGLLKVDKKHVRIVDLAALRGAFDARVQ